MTLISVIIPVYNSEKYLRECLDSVLSQTFQDIEIICINDGSADSSLSILEEYSRSHPNIKVINQPNQGAGIARNKGIAESEGEWITFLDSDDFLEPDAIEKLFSAAVSSGADTVRASGYYYDENDEKKTVDWSLRKGLVRDGDTFSWKDIPQDIYNLSAGNPWGMLVRKEIIDSNKILFSAYPRTEDITFTYNVYLFSEKITVIYDQLVFHRPSESGMESTKVKYPLVPLEARRDLEEKCRKDGFYGNVYKGFWIAGFRSYFQMIRLFLASGQKKEAEAYYNDFRRVLDEHPDLRFDKNSILGSRASDYYDQYRLALESPDFESYWNELTRPSREIRERFRLKEENDLRKRSEALA